MSEVFSDVKEEVSSNAIKQGDLTFRQIAEIFNEREFTDSERAYVQNLVVMINAKDKPSKDEYFWLKRFNYYLGLPTEPVPRKNKAPKPNAKDSTNNIDAKTFDVPVVDHVVTPSPSTESKQDAHSPDQTLAFDLDGKNPIEEAEALRAAIEQKGFTQKQLAEYTDKSERYVSDTLALLKLPKDIRVQVASGDLKPTGKLVRQYLNSNKPNRESNAVADSKTTAPITQVSISRDTAVTLCHLLIEVIQRYDELPLIDDIIDEDSSRRDIKALLEQRAFDVLNTVVQDA